ncbi:peroxisomal acyl-coenzyme A oxidase 3-like [Anthonomus grandis grandis]|uniref:peroxisomal acyl-coenzyme A oxidase 3-like n=1 Tax=Anthonomus grandis grandis TaxID=2921223 RepID=UPI00216622ED|nr:peroxisomal acyl-coenzyme A oxidase 3-like [Anthonomus grandis grandis]XP_050305251.1 peroxisomal acyl-coenzyme A oxidase 3-like [Anthonomus grandis grandis]
MTQVLEDFPSGPLDYYRKKASFDWKTMKMQFFGEEEVVYMENLYKELKKYPEFLPTDKPRSFDEERRNTYRQQAIIRANQDKLYSTKFSPFTQYVPAAMVKMGLTVKLFSGVLEKLGSERHAKLVQECEEGRISGAFCLTEIGHGTNVKGMRIVATYDKQTKKFIIHTPDFEAAKCWAGGLGNAATHVILYAQLYVNNKHHGLQMFVVPIRDPDTLLPYPGVTVGDMGEKIGLNGIDNGFLLFNNYKIPREFLLNRTGDVKEDGTYTTPFSSESERFGASLLALSASRVEVIGQSETFGAWALTTAIRYSGVRKQFGPGDQEIPVLEYQTQQYRLIPYLAAAYVYKHFTRHIHAEFMRMVNDFDNESISLLAIEVHIITSAAKPLSGWVMRDAIQSCREACGGHGYLKASGIGDLRGHQDATLTYEGENWVLNQQTSNFLLKVWPEVMSGVEVNSPLGSVNFLNNAKDILRFKFTVGSAEELCRPESILQIYQWLTCYLIELTTNKRQDRMDKGESKFDSRNNTQVYYAQKLSIAYFMHYLLEKFVEKIEQTTDPATKAVLQKMFALYGLFQLEKFISILYQGGYASGEQPAILIQDSITDLCSQLKNDAVALVDVLAPPDFILNSILGASDGQVYHRLQHAVFNSPYGVSRPSWWTDIVNWKAIGAKTQSKL